jgi:hypothetical protein
MKIDKREVARLLDGVSDPYLGSGWVVAESYNILGGLIYASDPRWDLASTGTFVDPELFLSFARLGAHGEPSKDSILRWVSEYGLLTREDTKYGPVIGSRVNQAPLTIADFRAEVLCAHQLLSLYADLREENFRALETKIHTETGLRSSSSYWSHTPLTDLENLFSYFRKMTGEVRRIMRWESKLPDYKEMKIVEGFDVWLARVGLEEVVKDRLANVTLGFDSGWTSSFFVEGDHQFPRSWDCPDLLSMMYLQFYLLVSDFEPLRRCENPACGLPFPVTRKNKRFCNASCRSGARYYRQRQETDTSGNGS